MGVFLKDPAARLDYAVDWAVVADGVAIVTSDWSVDPPGLAIEAEVLSGPRAGATLSGGTRGVVYRVANAVTFADGRRDTRSLTVRVDGR